MAKKVYLYDSQGFDFYTCEFDGLNTNGKPRLTIMKPGSPVENFLDHLESLGEDSGDYNLLCEEGKPAASILIVEMLAQIYLSANRSFESMSERLDEMQKCGIIYDRELQNVKVNIFENYDKKSQSTSYTFDLKIGDRYVDDFKEFKDAKDIFIRLYEFFFYIEHHIHIPLKKHLEVSEKLKKLVMRHTPNMFDEIEVN